MFKHLAKLVLVLALLCVPLSGAMASTRSSTRWIPTHTKGLRLSGNSRGRVSHVSSVSTLPASRRLRITVALKLRNEAGLDRYLAQISTPGSPVFGQHLSRAEFIKRYSPTRSQVRKVENYLTQKGLSDVQAQPNNLLVSATGTTVQIESAFNTHISEFRQHGRDVYANTQTAMVPSYLGSTVLSVLGLDNTGRMQLPPLRTSMSSQQMQTNSVHSLNPKGFQRAYDASSFSTGSNTSIAIFAQGDLTQTVSDLRTEERVNNLPRVPVNIIKVGGSSNDTSGTLEWNLDTQYSTGMAQNVRTLYIYDAPSLTDASVTLEFNKFVTQNVAKAGSASFGECELFAYQDGAMSADDQIFKEAAAQGQTVFASSGDSGGFCPVDNWWYDMETNYPASSPWVVAVGGTTLNVDSNGTYSHESAWSGSGGGISRIEPVPSWQKGIVMGYMYRDVPDISMDADPNSGARVYYRGSPETIGGTSLSSPLALGVWARLESYNRNQLGYAAPLLYKAYRTPGFHDVTMGSSYPYPATSGWDFATGLGTFDVVKISHYISR